MAIWNNINNTWRALWTSHVNINGIWRDSDVVNNVNNVWRESHRHELTADDILGFRLIYFMDPNPRHPLTPHLRLNLNLPVRFDTTGSTVMDSSEKGVAYQFWSPSYEEGILKYDGILYAVLRNGALLNVGADPIIGDDPRFSLPNIERESFTSSRLEEGLSICIHGLTFVQRTYFDHEAERDIVGWNRVFVNEDNFEIENFYPREPRIILPISYRSDNYQPNIEVGIARNISTADNNMLGTNGVMYHTIYSMRLNGDIKPFTVEIVR